MYNEISDLIGRMSEKDASEFLETYEEKGRVWCMHFLKAKYDIDVRKKDDSEGFIDEVVKQLRNAKEIIDRRLNSNSD